jgi:2-octaprenyl-6-methoxyphenol hydroxylase
MSGNRSQDGKYDLVIGGGGMIGASLAIALAPLGLRIAVVEAVSRVEAQQPSFDDRSTALSRSTQRMYEAMGLWDDIIASATPIRRIHISDKGRFGFSHIDATEQGVEALGYVVINRVLGQVLQSALSTASNIDMLCPARVTDIDAGEQGVAVVCANEEAGSRELHCCLLVAADGANSSLRPMLGICAKKTDYGQHAVIGNLLPERSLHGCAYERFTGQGPLAMLPIADDRAAFVWTVASSDAERVLGLDDGAFLAELQEAFGNRLGRFSKVGRRAAYPLSLSKAMRLTSNRGVLVGNSAHGLHPVAAQGFNLGMRDVAALCDCIADARSVHGEADIGDPEILKRYSDWRRDDQGKLVRFTDGIVRLFGSSRPPLRLARNVGMIGFDLVPGVRSLFARHMMGLAGRLPRLARGIPLS